MVGGGGGSAGALGTRDSSAVAGGGGGGSYAAKYYMTAGSKLHLCRSARAERRARQLRPPAVAAEIQLSTRVTASWRPWICHSDGGNGGLVSGGGGGASVATGDI